MVLQYENEFFREAIGSIELSNIFQKHLMRDLMESDIQGKEKQLIQYRISQYLIDYYYKDPFGNFTLATEPSFFVDKNYYTLANEPEGPLTFDATYEPNKYWYLLNNNFYLDKNEVIDGSRNYVTFTPKKITKYVYGKGLYYYSVNGEMLIDNENNTPQEGREYFVHTYEPDP